MEVDGQIDVPTALSLGKWTRYINDTEWIPESVWNLWRKNKFCLWRDSNLDSTVILPVAKYYTDWAIPFLSICVIYSYYKNDGTVEVLVYLPLYFIPKLLSVFQLNLV